MNLLEQIEKEMKEAMKAGEKPKYETLKMLKTDLTYEKAKTGAELTDDKMLEVVSRAAKRRKESIAEFRKGGREDLAAAEEAELAIIEAYLPKQMSEDEIAAFIDEKLKGMPGVTQKEFGAVMGQVMKELKGKADGAVVRKLLTAKFGG